MTAVTFEATDVQVRLFEKATDGESLYIGFGGGIRGTKTFGCLSLLLTLCRVFPGSRWAVVRKDLPTLRRNTFPSYNKLRREHFPGFAGEINGTDWTATCSNGSQILFFAESIDVDPELDRWKGLEVSGFLLEEADELQERSFHKAIERAGAWIMPAGKQPSPYVFCTFNPCSNWPKHVFYEPWRNGTMAPPYAFIPATQADNPFVPEQVRQAWKNMPEQEYKRFVEGDWEVLTGRFYDCLDARAHLIPRTALPVQLPDWWTYWGAFDWGYAHWAVYGAFAQDDQGNAYLLDSAWMRRGQDTDYAETVASLDVPKECLKPIYAGHDCWDQTFARGGSGVATWEVFAKNGLALIKADKDLVNGGRAVRRALSFTAGETPQLRFVDTKGNRRVFQQLAEIMPDENNVNKPAKVNADSEGRGGDDGADMLRYGVASHVPLARNPVPVRLNTQDRARSIDYVSGKVKPRESAQDEIDRMLQSDARILERVARRLPSKTW